jgi:hypothetical protein
MKPKVGSLKKLIKIDKTVAKLKEDPFIKGKKRDITRCTNEIQIIW